MYRAGDGDGDITSKHSNGRKKAKEEAASVALPSSSLPKEEEGGRGKESPCVGDPGRPLGKGV